MPICLRSTFAEEESENYLKKKLFKNHFFPVYSTEWIGRKMMDDLDLFVREDYK